MATQLVRRAISRVPALAPVATATLLRSHASEAQGQKMEPAGMPDSNSKTFQIHRWNPDSPQNPELRIYECGPMTQILSGGPTMITPLPSTERKSPAQNPGEDIPSYRKKLDWMNLDPAALPHANSNTEHSDMESSDMESYDDPAISEFCQFMGISLSRLREMCDLCIEPNLRCPGGAVTLRNADKQVGVRDLAALALKLYNDTKLKNFKLVKVCKATFSACIFGGLTFMAREDGSEECPLFRGVVYQLGGDNAIFCEIKEDDKVTLLPFDDDYVSSETTCGSEDHAPFICKNGSDSEDGSVTGSGDH